MSKEIPVAGLRQKLMRMKFGPRPSEAENFAGPSPSAISHRPPSHVLITVICCHCALADARKSDHSRPFPQARHTLSYNSSSAPNLLTLNTPNPRPLLTMTNRAGIAPRQRPRSVSLASKPSTIHNSDNDNQRRPMTSAARSNSVRSRAGPLSQPTMMTEAEFRRLPTSIQ